MSRQGCTLILIQMLAFSVFLLIYITIRWCRTIVLLGYVSKSGDEVQFGSPKYFLLCGLGGVISCGTTHTAIVPLDLVKCRIQVNPEKYKGIIQGFRTTVREEGFRALAKGWAPTLIGYSCQGLGKFGFYEMFKIFYSDVLGEVWFLCCFLSAISSLLFATLDSFEWNDFVF
ncbi:unnamed protein product [Onchocerca flexuosa]|uniref:Phosphate carrier protein, mitochondrial n=1 Tax=Onchocerca flexuosa TaxID=387005 RepID=A0A183HNF4_9BILA|nr:unnamed protein product [Onchocerca flexuosa]